MDSRRDNHWPHGIGTWVIPPLPTEFRDTSGATFQRAIFSDRVGSEICLVLLEAEAMAPSLATPSILKATVGTAVTKFGPLVWILWSIRESGHVIVSYEQFLNPLNADSQQLLIDVSAQGFLKVALVNSSAGAVIDIVEFENCFIGPEHVEAARQLNTEFQGEPSEIAEFTRAVEQFMRDEPIEDLIDFE